MAVQDEVPKSRITLRYRTEINGTPEDVNLPLRLLIIGDLSLGTSSDRKVDLDERRIRNLDGTNTNSLMRDMKITLKTQVPNKIDPSNSENLELNLPITGLKSFSPDEVAKNVPKLRALLMLRKLLVEVEANIGNSKEFRKAVTDLYANEEAFKKVKEELKGFESFTVPTSDAGKK